MDGRKSGIASRAPRIYVYSSHTHAFDVVNQLG